MNYLVILKIKVYLTKLVKRRKENTIFFTNIKIKDHRWEEEIREGTKIKTHPKLLLIFLNFIKSGPQLGLQILIQN
jgi:hypothetical protein